MKIKKALSRLLKVTLLTATGIVLLVAATIIVLYSPWVQDLVRERLVEKVNSVEGMNMTLDSLRITPPLNVELAGLSLTDRGDTIVAARSLQASVNPFGLLAGKAWVSHATLRDAVYRMGNADSAMQLGLKARMVELDPASVAIATMAIDIEHGRLDGADVRIIIRPDTTAATAADSVKSPSTMTVSLGALDITDLTYSMRMLPTIDSLATHIASGRLEDGKIDLGAQTVELRMFGGHGLDAAYIAPDSATVAATPVAPADSTGASAPWVVSIDSIRFDDSRALYTTRGVTPLPGFDPAYIAVDSLWLAISHFYNRASTVRLPLQLNATERCGVQLAASGTLDIDSAAMTFTGWHISTPVTTLTASGMMGMGNPVADTALPLALKAEGHVGVSDMRKLFPAFMPYLASLPADGAATLNLDVNGSMADLHIDRGELSLPPMLTLKADGSVAHLDNPDLLDGSVTLNGSIGNLNALKNTVMGPSGKSFNIPPMRLAGHVDMNRGTVTGNLRAVTAGGSIALTGMFNASRERYDASVKATSFPVASIMPGLGVGNVTATLDAAGHGFNPFKRSTAAHVNLDVASAEYNKYTYSAITGTVDLADGQAQVLLSSDMADAPFSLKAQGNLDGDTYNWTANATARGVNLYALHLSETPSSVSAGLDGTVSYTPKGNVVAATFNIGSFSMKGADSSFDIDHVTARINSDDSLTNASLHNYDLYTYFSARTGIMGIVDGFTAAADTLTAQLASHKLDVSALQRTLPQMSLDVNGGTHNALAKILAARNMGMRHLSLNVSNDSLIHLDAGVTGFNSGNTRLDTITFAAQQHGKALRFSGALDNAPGTLDNWAHVRLKGSVDRNSLDMRFDQHDIGGRLGFDLGLTASIADSVVRVRLLPLDPMIGYQRWAVNLDNFISYDIPHRHLDANIKMNGGGSSLTLMTEHDSHDHVHVDGDTEPQEDVVLKIDNIHIADWITINPYAPPMKGDLSADMRLNWGHDNVMAHGNVALDNFIYGREPVGSFKADVDVSTAMSGRVTAAADLYVDDVKTVTLNGSLNDTTATSPFNLDLRMIRFPLATVNPFLPAGMARLSGTLNGDMAVTGDTKAPKLNGWLAFDSTAVRLAMTGTSYAFSDVKIPVEDNVVRFNGFNIKAVNDNPLSVNGSVSLKDFASPAIDLSLNASDMQIVNTNRAARGADVYGRAFIDLDATVKGNLSFMNVNASLSILPRTNVTYVMADATNAITQQGKNDMVKFVSFDDTTAVAKADSILQQSTMMVLNATLNVESGSTLGVDLGTDGKNRVQLQGEGQMSYTMSPVNSGRMLGRLMINKGYVRYSPPFMGEKKFDFLEGSYVAFNGNMMNPTLNVRAVDVIKANVTQQGQNSRLVNFDVGLTVTGTLSQMKVKFDLSTDDDITIANELQAMSPDQRENQAMNMLLYNMYTGPGTKGNGNLSGNALYSFLESQLNTWAANTIKGVDLSFGIDQYDRTLNGSTSTTTSYSYKVSKSLFNDRFKIVVGGNYSTDANADENFSQNLINDIAFEYYINAAQTMYVRLFRHTGYESILEGEITQTGVGFVYRRKLQRLIELFKPWHQDRVRLGSGRSGAVADTVPQAQTDSIPTAVSPAPADSTATVSTTSNPNASGHDQK